MASEGDDFGAQLIALLPNMRRFAMSLARSPDIADDLVQSACERALASADTFQQGTRFDAWMFRIIRNLWIDRIRRDRTAGPQEDIDERPDLVGVSGEQVVEARLTMRSVGEAIELLPDEQREVLWLTCVEDIPYREVAEMLDVPIGTVMSRLSRARKKLAELAGISGDSGRSSDGSGEKT
jgi:RNA polymerase sigma-70 factor, ECF subfamily